MSDPTPQVDPDSPKPRKVQQRTIDNKVRIVDAAAVEFIAKGYAGTSVSDIIVRAFSNKNFFYSHFPGGKPDVAKEIMFMTTFDGQQDPPHPLMAQQIYDIAMILAYRARTEARILAALKLSFEQAAIEEYGTPWPDWVVFNTQQIKEAQKRGEIRPHLVAEDEARQLPGLWAGLILTTGSIDGGYENVERYVSHGYRNTMKAWAFPEVVADIDFSVNRGEMLYKKFLEEQERSS
ncbi:TetR family transcriptional regulator [Streptomyces sp. NPDC001068]|uniref:TetR family transcriptional regulator n=1 Tax=Streptomyces sp. NPDC001068 TaxID=3364544 RepID=UPI003680FA35